MLNEWRALVGVPPVEHDPAQSAGCAAHAEYYRLNHEFGHFEDPSKPGYSEAGAKAAMTSVLAYASGERGPWTWENAVYHRADLLNPRLVTTGFWNEHDLACMGALSTDTSRTTPKLTSYTYPYDGQQGVETIFGCQEIPNPCNAVPGNDGTEPTGFIPSVQFNAPRPYFYEIDVDGAQLVPDGGMPVELTIDGVQSGFAMIPRRPLAEGTWYTASAAGSVGESRFRSRCGTGHPPAGWTCHSAATRKATTKRRRPPSCTLRSGESAPARRSTPRPSGWRTRPASGAGRSTFC